MPGDSAKTYRQYQPFSHIDPVHPDEQLHVNEPSLLIQLPPLKHGAKALHSSISAKFDKFTAQMYEQLIKK
jgi:hypothetical protein